MVKLTPELIHEMNSLKNEYETELRKQTKNEKNNAKIALEKLRDFLDRIEIKMPKPNYKYDHKDRTTWEFSECKVVTNAKRQVVGLRWIRNLSFKYPQYALLRQ